jgi:tRNA/rRNA methyltransferase
MAADNPTSGESTAGNAPAVILVRPQLGQNIGMVARAMLNFGLTELRLVAPRDGWPNEEAVNAASGADRVVEGATIFETTEAAVADLQRVFATTARPRDMVKPVFTPAAAVAELRDAASAGQRAGLLFGPERSGLTNDDVVLAEAIVTVPLNPAFTSLNLAQSVVLVAYEWFQAGAPAAPRPLRGEQSSPSATAEELGNFFRRLENALDASGFLRVREKRPIMVRHLRNIFTRARLTQQEVNTLHGVVASLWKAPPPRDEGGDEGESGGG